jgi:hypothetical protein
MKRNPKPFSVEIKKSRVQGHRHQLPPRRLFGLTPAQITPSVQENEPLLASQPPAAPRILPSILEPARSHSEAVEPVRRKSSPRSKSDQGQMEFSLNTIADAANDAPDGDRMVPAAKWHTDASLGEEPTTLVNKTQAQELERPETRTRKPRKIGSESDVPATVPQPMPQLEMVPGTQVVEPAPVTGSQRVGPHRLTKRQAAAVQLPRNERWKRRLHPAAW